MLLTRGTCTLGKLNKYLGKRAADEGSFSRYQDVDFCVTPDAICKNFYWTRELRWILGFFEWSDRVQSYFDLNTGWKYIDELKKFVLDDMVDTDFISKVTNIVTRKCHDGKCSDNDIRFEMERKNYFHKIVFDVFNLPLTDRPTASPIIRPRTVSPTVTRAASFPSPEPLDASVDATTDKVGKKKGQSQKIKVLEPSSAQFLMSYHHYLVFAFIFPIASFIF